MAECYGSACVCKSPGRYKSMVRNGISQCESEFQCVGMYKCLKEQEGESGSRRDRESKCGTELDK